MLSTRRSFQSAGYILKLLTNNKTYTMKELIMFLANALPRESIVERISNAAADCIERPSDENYNILEGMCHLLLSKRVTDKEGVMGAIEALDKIERGSELLTPKEN